LLTNQDDIEAQRRECRIRQVSIRLPLVQSWLHLHRFATGRYFCKRFVLYDIHFKGQADQKAVLETGIQVSRTSLAPSYVELTRKVRAHSCYLKECVCATIVATRLVDGSRGGEVPDGSRSIPQHTVGGIEVARQDVQGIFRIPRLKLL
jgi:hypothetical protein